MARYFAWHRFETLASKEFIQLIRDKMTFMYIIILSLIEVALFSIVFNNNPHHLPTALLNSDPSPFTRSIIKGLENTRYFNITKFPKTEAEGEYLIASNQVQFFISFPSDFSRDVVRGKKPQASLISDSLNPMAVANAIGAAKGLEKDILALDIKGPLKKTNPTLTSTPFSFNVQERYNPENNPHIFSVPGLIGALLGGILFMMTVISITREKDQGTMESLLTTPAHPIEILLSKILPYILIAYIQLSLMLALAHYGFHIPFRGSLLLLYIASLPFIVASLLLGLLVSAISKSQTQAMQLGGFFLLPNLLFSGFVFPFRGMPEWAQWGGNILPLTHFIRILTGIMIKGTSVTIIVEDIWPILIFIFLIVPIIIMLFRQTLD